MYVIVKRRFKTAEELLSKRFSLFNIEIIIPEKEAEKLPDDVVLSLKLQGNYFTFMDIK